MIKYKVVISPNSNYYNAISYSFGEDAVFEFDEKKSNSDRYYCGSIAWSGGDFAKGTA